MRGDRGVKQDDLTLDSNGHRLAIPLPERGTPLDVSEEEGDGTGGEIGHDPIPYVRPAVVLADCRTRTRGSRQRLAGSSLR
jgi:hypothetical protein